MKRLNECANREAYESGPTDEEWSEFFRVRIGDIFSNLIIACTHRSILPLYLVAAVFMALLLWAPYEHRAAPVPPAPKPYWLVVTPDGVVAATFNPSATICTPGWSIPNGVQFKVVRMPSKFDDPCNPKSWSNPSYGVRIAEH